MRVSIITVHLQIWPGLLKGAPCLSFHIAQPSGGVVGDFTEDVPEVAEGVANEDVVVVHEPEDHRILQLQGSPQTRAIWSTEV